MAAERKTLIGIVVLIVLVSFHIWYTVSVSDAAMQLAEANSLAIITNRQVIQVNTDKAEMYQIINDARWLEILARMERLEQVSKRSK